MKQVLTVSQNLILSPSAERELRHCRHCQSEIPKLLRDEFCCHGCGSAFNLINSFELNRFYQIVQENHEAIIPAQVQRLDYQLFDAPEFQKNFVEEAGPNQQSAHFYLNNLSCYACVWVCEQLTQQIDPKAKLSINLASGAATLDFVHSKVALSQFFRKFEALGYRVSPNRNFQQSQRQGIARIGVALFCLTNIMLLAFPEYLGSAALELQFRNLFRWIAAALAGFSISFAGWPFLQGAYLSLKNREVHLDLPIGLALLVCYSYSLFNTINGAAHVYFDSTAAVVALLLIGRWVQAGALSQIAREQAQFFEGKACFVRVVQDEGSEKLVNLPCVAAQTVLNILPGELIPLDCELLSPLAEVNYSFLTGESASQALQLGARLKAGAVNGSIPIQVRCLEAGAQSFLLQIEKASQDLYRHKGKFLGLSEKITKGFVYFVLSMAFLVLLWNWQYSAEQAITRFAAVLLIACPCIFGFGAPLVLARAMTLGLQRGTLFRSQKALERLHEVRRFFFDKTGTLTEDESTLNETEWHDINLVHQNLDRAQLLELFRLLPSLSRHQTLASLGQYAGDGPVARAEVKAVREIFGQGLSLVWKGKDIRIGRAPFCLPQQKLRPDDLEYSYLSINGQSVLRFRLDDRARPEAFSQVEYLKQRGCEICILSGDSLERAQNVGQLLGLEKTQVHATLSPKEKLEHIESKMTTAMVGNGINDSLALSGVDIGIAMANAMDSLKDKADIIFLLPGIHPLKQAIELSLATRRAMLRCFGFAALFNLIGMTLAISGVATPILAAILMPLSSLTIFSIARCWS